MRDKELKLYDAITNIDDKLLEKPQRAKVNWLKIVAIAAMFAIIVGIGATALGRDNKLPIDDSPDIEKPVTEVTDTTDIEPPVDSTTATSPVTEITENTDSPESDPPLDLPLIPLSFNNGGMGFEGYMVYDISELVNANPADIYSLPERLPVYKNNIYYSYPDHITLGIDYEAMESLLMEYADRFGITDYEIKTDEPDEEQKEKIIKYLSPEGKELASMEHFNLYTMWIETEDIKVSVNVHLGVSIRYKNGIELPENLNFGHYSSYEDMCEVAEYIGEEYSLFFEGMENPTLNIFGGDYNIFKEQGYDIQFFDNSGSDVDRIINYNFKSVSFLPNDEGKLWIIRPDSEINGEKLGDYPIITYEEAEAMLYEGKYLTTVTDYAVSENSIVEKAELIYRTGGEEEYYLPYFRFYIDIDREVEGMKTYGAFYVPAVEPEYLENVAVWDGHFN